VIGGISTVSELDVQGLFASASTTAGSGTSLDLRDLLATLNGYDVSCNGSYDASCNGIGGGHTGAVSGQFASRSASTLLMASSASQLQKQTTTAATPKTMLITHGDAMSYDGSCYGDESNVKVVAPGSSPTRKSANMTERVVVPSSEHVAEIVGRQGKNLIADYGTGDRTIG